jgi:hypothetical protein
MIEGIIYFPLQKEIVEMITTKVVMLIKSCQSGGQPNGHNHVEISNNLWISKLTISLTRIYKKASKPSLKSSRNLRHGDLRGSWFEVM